MTTKFDKMIAYLDGLLPKNDITFDHVVFGDHVKN